MIFEEALLSLMGSAQAETADQRVGHGGRFHLEIDPLEFSFLINQKVWRIIPMYSRPMNFFSP